MWIIRNIRLFKNWPDLYGMFGEPVVRLRNGVEMLLTSRHDIPIVWEVFGEKVYGELPKDAKVIVDVGANLGAFTLYALTTTNAKVCAYEPVFSNYWRLEHNLARFERKCIRPEAVSKTKVATKIYLAEGGDSGHHSMLRGEGTGDKFVEVPCTTLDAIIDEVGQIDFLKIDIEGAEEQVLGACTKLDKVKEIAVEGNYARLVPLLKGFEVTKGKHGVLFARNRTAKRI